MLSKGMYILEDSALTCLFHVVEWITNGSFYQFWHWLHIFCIQHDFLCVYIWHRNNKEQEWKQLEQFYGTCTLL